MSERVRLGVNIDHVATIRQARGGDQPDPFDAARVVAEAGAEGLTLHLRMDRRHIQEDDVTRIRDGIALPLNIEMAATDEMMGLARRFRPSKVTLVPESPGEITTLGGLDCISQEGPIRRFCEVGAEAGFQVAAFIDPDVTQVERAHSLGLREVEIHTGLYADAQDDPAGALEDIRRAAGRGAELGVVIAAGHGLDVGNVGPVAALPHVEELNIGHSIVARAVFLGLRAAILEIREEMDRARA